MIKAGGPWRTVDAAEYATDEYLDWFNNRQLDGDRGGTSAGEREEFDCDHHGDRQIAELTQSCVSGRARVVRVLAMENWSQAAVCSEVPEGANGQRRMYDMRSWSRGRVGRAKRR